MVNIPSLVSPQSIAHICCLHLLGSYLYVAHLHSWEQPEEGYIVTETLSKVSPNYAVSLVKYIIHKQPLERL